LTIKVERFIFKIRFKLTNLTTPRLIGEGC
jgi:hypothetical protein